MELVQVCIAKIDQCFDISSQSNDLKQQLAATGMPISGPLPASITMPYAVSTT